MPSIVGQQHLIGAEEIGGVPSPRVNPHHQRDVDQEQSHYDEQPCRPPADRLAAGLPDTFTWTV